VPDNVVPIKASDWGTADSSYDREEFYCSSRSADGQSATLSVTIPAHMAAQLAVFVQSGNFPYKTREDAFRDALHHRFHDLDEMGALDHESSRRIALWRRQEELARRAAELESTEALIRDTEAMVKKIRGMPRPDFVMLEQVVRDAEAAADQLHEPWCGQLLATVEGLREMAEDAGVDLGGEGDR
jgi:Arc/MetJ-type ribon-helix-helix transcriptional regulator